MTLKVTSLAIGESLKLLKGSRQVAWYKHSCSRAVFRFRRIVTIKGKVASVTIEKGLGTSADEEAAFLIDSGYVKMT